MITFRPTKAWAKAHKLKPEGCLFPESPCYCVLDHFDEHLHGFCVGIRLEDESDLDIIAFCNRTFNPETGGQDEAGRLWHPSEALLIATYISFSVTQAIQQIPDIRTELGNMGRKRTRAIKRARTIKEELVSDG